MDAHPEDLPDWILPLMFSGIDSSQAGDTQLRTDLETLLRHRRANGDLAGRLTSQQILSVIQSLPRLTEEELDELGHHESSCPICLNTHLASLAEEEMAHVMDYPAHPVENLGVTRLVQTCGHIFCRKDLLTWINDGHPSCPLCRTPVLKPASDPKPSGSNTSTSGIGDASEDDHEATDNRAFDQALDRIMAAYQDERRRMRAAPSYGGMFGQPDGPGVARAHAYEDRSAYVGMYS